MTKLHKMPQVECCGVLCAGPLFCARGESFSPLSSRKWGANFFFKSPPSPRKKTVSGFFQLRKQTSKKRPFIIHVAHPLSILRCNSESGPAFTQKSKIIGRAALLVAKDRAPQPHIHGEMFLFPHLTSLLPPHKCTNGILVFIPPRPT